MHGRCARAAADRQPRLRRDAAARARRGGADLRRRAARALHQRVLKALADECVRAIFFMVGRQASADPQLVRQVRAAGHTIGTHTQNHLLFRMPADRAAYEIDTGIASVGAAFGSQRALAPFFRFPGLFRTTEAEQHLRSRGLMAWSVDVNSYDWKKISSGHMLNHTLADLEKRRGGILLMHDVQAKTALMLPALLRRAEGARLSHRPCGAVGPSADAGPRRRRAATQPKLQAPPVVTSSHGSTRAASARPAARAATRGAFASPGGNGLFEAIFTSSAPRWGESAVAPSPCARDPKAAKLDAAFVQPAARSARLDKSAIDPRHRRPERTAADRVSAEEELSRGRIRLEGFDREQRVAAPVPRQDRGLLRRPARAGVDGRGAAGASGIRKSTISRRSRSPACRGRRRSRPARSTRSARTACSRRCGRCSRRRASSRPRRRRCSARRPRRRSARPRRSSRSIRTRCPRPTRTRPRRSTGRTTAATSPAASSTITRAATATWRS